MSIATDHALATIASILSPSEGPKKKPAPTEQTAGAPLPVAKVVAEPAVEAPAVEASAIEAPSIVADGYSRIGPGPMAAIRFKWTARHADDGYYVDETIGTDSAPVISGPMGGDEAIQFVDDRVREAQERFEALKNEMTGRGPVAPILASGGGEK